MDLSEKQVTIMEKKDTIVSEVEVDRQQVKPVGASVGSNAEPVSCLEVAEGKNVAGDFIQKKLSKKSQQKPCSKMEEVEAKVYKMEMELASKEGANLGSNAEPVRDVEVAEFKGGAGNCTEKELSRKPQQEEAAKPEQGEIIGEHRKICRKGKLDCCKWCPHDHRKYCPIGIEEESRKKNIKGLQAQASVTEAYKAVDDLEELTRSKRKNRTVVESSSGDVPEEFDNNKPKKGKSASIGKLSEKEETILKVAEVVGVELPNPDRSKNYTSGSFSSCGLSWCREQYNTNKALLDAVSQMVVGMTHSDFVKEAVKRLPAAQDEFAELYATQRLEMKVGKAVMRSYRAAPRNVKYTILEQLVLDHNISLKELKEALGVTKHQWERAQAGIEAIRSGHKKKAENGGKMHVDPDTVKKFVDYCLRPDNIQDVAYGSRVVEVDDGTSFVCPQWIRKNHRAKMARAFKQEFSEKVVKMPSRTWMYKVMDWIGKKDMVSLAGLDNTDVAGKEAMIGTAQLAVTVMNNLGADMPAELIQKVTDMRKEMEDCKAVLRQHLEDSMEKDSHVSSHCLNHCLNSSDGFTCTHAHTECEMCVKPFAALALVDLMITKVRNERQKKIFKREHELHLRNIILFMGHIVRSVVQRPMQDATIESMDANHRVVVVDWAMKWLALYHREQQSAFYAKAGLNWHQVCVIETATQMEWCNFYLRQSRLHGRFSICLCMQ